MGLRGWVLAGLFALGGLGSGWWQHKVAPPKAAQKEAAEPEPQIDWRDGPYKADLGGVGTIAVPKGYEFTDGNGMRKLIEASHDLVDGER